MRRDFAVLLMIVLMGPTGCGRAAPAAAEPSVEVENESSSDGLATNDLIRLSYRDDLSVGQWHVLERWNGSRWAGTHALVAAAFAEGAHTVPSGADFAIIDIDYGPDAELYVLMPDALEPGTSRICLHDHAAACSDNLEVVD